MSYLSVSSEERTYLRELAKKQLEYAKLPIMTQRTKDWIAHNRCEGSRPMIVIEALTFWPDVRPQLRCESETARWLEDQLLRTIFIHERIGDDQVVPDYVAVPLQLDFRLFDMDKSRQSTADSIGYHIEPVIKDLPADLEKIADSRFIHDAKCTLSLEDFVIETVGDILPPRRKNFANHWAFGITQHVVDLMGMENMYLSMIDEPDSFHELMRRICDDLILYLRWQEDQELLLLNNGNDYMGSGSYCFSDELPKKDFKGKVRSIDTWGHLNSQESIGISPNMFQDFIAPYYLDLAKEFGLLYYGCCEPADPFWDKGISQLPNLRKVSISPWCNEAIMAERLSEKRIIYSRKPSPNFLGVETAFDQQAFTRSIQSTIQLTQQCHTEFIFRDVYKLNGNLEKLKQVVAIVRNLTAR